MKRLILCLFLLCFLTGCTMERRNDYLSVQDHVEQPTTRPTEKEEAEIPVVHNRTELRGALLSLIRNWQETGVVQITDYEGDVEGDLNEALLYATKQDPIGAYGVDYADGEIIGEGERMQIQFSIVFRRSAAETNAIIPVTDNAEVLVKINEALENFSTALTLRIRNYTEEDFSAHILRYCLENPRTVLAIPEFSAELYPEEGSHRILELHFSYPESKDSMRSKLYSMQTLFRSSALHAERGQTEAERAEDIFRYLTGRASSYKLGTETPVMPAYSLLSEKIAHDLSFAIVFHDRCKEGELSSAIVTGEKDGAPYYWNLLYLDGQPYYVDLMRSLSYGEASLTLLYEEDLLAEGYVWDMEQYPTITRPTEEPTEESQGTSEGETEEATEESQEATENTESSSPTQ